MIIVKPIKITIITICYNSQDTIEDTIQSILSQNYAGLEYIIIDGGSTDGTLPIIHKYKDKISKIVSEPDRGIYDAMNKGLSLASGDVIGFLNADDIYFDRNVLQRINETFQAHHIDACYSDIVYVDRMNVNRIVRYWQSRSYVCGLFQKGWVPPHPTFFVRSRVYRCHGVFDLNYKISADVELMMRFMAKHRISAIYKPGILVRMRVGGISNKIWFNVVKQNLEVRSAAHKNGFRLSLLFLLYKLFEKIPQFFKTPQKAL